jgi:hypothetical protein
MSFPSLAPPNIWNFDASCFPTATLLTPLRQRFDSWRSSIPPRRGENVISLDLARPVVLGERMVWILLPPPVIPVNPIRITTDGAKGEVMPEHVPMHTNEIARLVLRARTTLETTLYDLIVVIREEIGPDEEHLVTPIIVHLLNSGRVKFVDGLQQRRVVCS